MRQTLRTNPLYLRYRYSTVYLKLRALGKAFKMRRALPRYVGSEHCCPVCGTHLREFKPLWKSFIKNAADAGYVYPLTSLETFNVFAMCCPACDASDRYRLYALYFDRVFRAFDPDRRYRLVDFCPPPTFRKKIESYSFIEFRSADLLSGDADDRIDITDMHPYPDNSIDIFVCSHVLEHIAEDRKAMAELYRALKPGGFAIVMVPIVHGVQETHEDPAINTPELRCKYYLLADHLRQYGRKDFVNRLTTAGFQVEEVGVGFFGESAFRRAGIARDSVLYIGRKGLDTLPDHAKSG